MLLYDISQVLFYELTTCSTTYFEYSTKENTEVLILNKRELRQAKDYIHNTIRVQRPEMCKSQLAITVSIFRVHYGTQNSLTKSDRRQDVQIFVSF